MSSKCVSETWMEIASDCLLSASCPQDELNGLLFFNQHQLDEVTLEIVLSHVPPDSILRTRQVCQLWRRLMTRRSFWKKACLNDGTDWESIPNAVKDKENSWFVFYALCKNRTLSKNYIKNHSGEHGLDHWVLPPGITVIDGEEFLNSISVESPPVGVPPIPFQPEFVDAPNVAFSTTVHGDFMYCKIDLWEEGLTPSIMTQIMPFQLTLSLLFASPPRIFDERFPWISLYGEVQLRYWSAKTTKDGSEPVEMLVQEMSKYLPTPTPWVKVTTSIDILQFDPDCPFRYAVVRVKGEPLGVCKIKFSRISLRVNCLNTPCK